MTNITAPTTKVEAPATSPATPGEAGDNRHLDHSLTSGIAWTAVFRWAAQIVSWGCMFYAARKLAPSDFGLVAMASLAIGLMRMVESVGLDAVFVQDRTIHGDVQARLAGFVLLLGASLSVLFVLLAPLGGYFFEEPRVTGVIRVLSVVMLLDAIQVVPRALLQRDLAFRRLAVVTFVQLVVTSVTLVVGAMLGLGYWALVLNTVTGMAAATVLLLIWAPYRISWPYRIRELATPIVHGWRVLGSRIAWYAYTSADQTIVGRVLGADRLGAYSFATTFANVPQEEVSSLFSKVVPGIFSAVQHSKAELRRYFLLLTECVTVLTFPLSIGMATVADLMVPLALGKGWTQVVGPLQLLCLYSVVTSSQLMASHVLLWTGQFRKYMWLSILNLVCIPTALWIGVKFGLNGVGWAWVCVSPILAAPGLFFAFRTTETKTGQWLNSMLPAATASVALVAAVFLVRAVMPHTLPLPEQAAAAVSVGAIAYIVTLYVLFPARVRRLTEFAKSARRGTANA